jgi:uncharacterized protein (TIGR02453 family)
MGPELQILTPAPERAFTWRRPQTVPPTTLSERLPSQMDIPDFRGFRPAALRFLRELARNNRKEWFEAHRETYEVEVRGPMLALLDSFDVRLGELAPELAADPKRSVFRIYRDVRFSKDKSPYKTHVAFWVSHRALGRAGAMPIHGGAGLYFHLEPAASMVAAGIWMPPTVELARIREALVADFPRFESARRKLRRGFGDLSEEAVLQRQPRGYSAAGPVARWLRYQSFTVSRPIPAADLRQVDLPDRLARAYRPAIPFVRWLNGALGLPAANRR